VENIAELDRKTLIIRLQLQKPVPSKSSGKTLVIASTHGAVATEVRYRGKPIVVVANAFVYRTEKKVTHSAEQVAGGKSRHEGHRT
jgi:hypothetical protein